jgi:hypothetical protein
MVRIYLTEKGLWFHGLCENGNTFVNLGEQIFKNEENVEIMENFQTSRGPK